MAWWKPVHYSISKCVIVLRKKPKYKKYLSLVLHASFCYLTRALLKRSTGQLILPTLTGHKGEKIWAMSMVASQNIVTVAKYGAFFLDDVKWHTLGAKTRENRENLRLCWWAKRYFFKTWLGEGSFGRFLTIFKETFGGFFYHEGPSFYFFKVAGQQKTHLEWERRSRGPKKVRGGRRKKKKHAIILESKFNRFDSGIFTDLLSPLRVIDKQWVGKKRDTKLWIHIMKQLPKEKKWQ